MSFGFETKSDMIGELIAHLGTSSILVGSFTLADICGGGGIRKFPNFFLNSWGWLLYLQDNLRCYLNGIQTYNSSW